MNLNQIVKERILSEIIRPLKARQGGSKWKVVVLDRESTRILSSCCKISDLMVEGVTLVEDLQKRRQPFPKFEGIYILVPTQESISRLIEDFSKKNPQYANAHIFFTETCPDSLFKRLSSSKIVRRVKTLKEVYMSFIPYESRVFTLDAPETFFNFYKTHRTAEDMNALEKVAEQVATICTTLNEFPIVVYRKGFDRTAEFANMVGKVLKAYKKDDSSLGSGPEKHRSKLIILDRGFDQVTPILHELTLQAMTYDLLDIKNDVYDYITDEGVRKEVRLDEDDELWSKNRHKHMGVMTKEIGTLFKKFSSAKMGSSDSSNIKDLAVLLKKMPQYQKELNHFGVHLKLADENMAKYLSGVNKLVEAEQDLVTLETAKGEPVTDPMKLIIPLLVDPAVKKEDRLKLILLYISTQNGVTREAFDKLLQHANIEMADRETLLNAAELGSNIVIDEGRKKVWKVNRRDRSMDTVFTSSRWVPVIKDVMEDATEGKTLFNSPVELFGIISDHSTADRQPIDGPARSARFGVGDRSNPNVQFPKPRLIVFIVGGVTYSEIRTAYEIANAKKDWDVVIGSDQIITPHQYLRNLHDLNKSNRVETVINEIDELHV